MFATIAVMPNPTALGSHCLPTRQEKHALMMQCHLISTMIHTLLEELPQTAVSHVTEWFMLAANWPAQGK